MKHKRISYSSTLGSKANPTQTLLHKETPPPPFFRSIFCFFLRQATHEGIRTGRRRGNLRPLCAAGAARRRRRCQRRPTRRLHPCRKRTCSKRAAPAPLALGVTRVDGRETKGGGGGSRTVLDGHENDQSEPPPTHPIAPAREGLFVRAARRAALCRRFSAIAASCLPTSSAWRIQKSCLHAQGCIREARSV